MADQNYYSGHFGGSNGPDENDQQQRMNADVITASSVAMHANYGNVLSNAGDEISEQKFNMIIAGLLLYGFAVNAVLCFLLTDLVIGIPPFVSLIVYIVFGMILGSIICRKTNNPIIGFIGYNMIVVPMGIMITPFLNYYEITTVRYAFCVMGFCMLLMIGLAYAYPKFFLSLGKMLFLCLLMGIVCEVVMWCLNLSSGIFDFVMIAVFLGYIGLDWARAQENPKTTNNAIFCAFMIYVDLINLLLRLVRLLAKSKD